LRFVSIRWLVLALALQAPVSLAQTRDSAIEADLHALESADLVAAQAAAHRLLSDIPPEQLASYLAAIGPKRDSTPLTALAGVIAAAEQASAESLVAYASRAARSRGDALAHHAPWSDADLSAFLRLAVVSPDRFVEDPVFRGRIVSRLPDVLDRRAPVLLREETLTALDNLPGFDFATSERLAVAWDLAPRSSLGRQVDFTRAAPLRFSSDQAPILASVYSLPSTFFTAAQAESLLRAVHTISPQRRLLVLADLPNRIALAKAAPELGVDLLDAWGERFTPWPRDPLSLTRGKDGGLTVLMRPNLQSGRETDADMGRALVNALPAALDKSWGGGEGTRWTTAPIPFHNGQLLLGRDAVWISLHSLETRILAMLHTDRVPMETFATRGGAQLYVTAAQRAARELTVLYGRPVRFIHPLPVASESAATQGALLRRLGGGAGYDLDSIVTLLASPAGPRALVASIARGSALLAQLTAGEWDRLRQGYALHGQGKEVAAAVRAHMQSEHTEALESFLDLVAQHLKDQGLIVDRLPLLAMPASLLAEPPGNESEFLITWNNVVLEVRPNLRRAEGFSSLLDSGDAAATETFRAAGYHLDLLPSLVASVIANGGYRCASNQFREGDPVEIGPVKARTDGTAHKR
jgi:hypothetical protein